jgi:hypothetical protein
MKSLRTIALITATAAATFVAGGSVMAWATGSGSTALARHQPMSNVVPHIAASIDTAVESKYTPISPCRIVDTRLAGGAIAAGSSRSFFAAGTTGFAAQGGNSSGCGIPSAATAIAVTVIAVGATGTGFLRAWAFGSTPPLSSFLNYANSVAVTGAGNVPINGVGARHITVSANLHSTNVVIDVTGYFIRPMTAVVSFVGTLIHGSRVTASISLGTGNYEVDFDRDVSNCAYSLTSFDAAVFGFAEPRVFNAQGVFVEFTNTSNTATNAGFYLIVDC